MSHHIFLLAVVIYSYIKTSTLGYKKGCISSKDMQPYKFSQILFNVFNPSCSIRGC